MRVLVTGATGRVGRLLVPMLLDEEYSVRTLQRGVSGAGVQWPADVEVQIGSITSRETVDRALQEVDVVCHLAALMPPNSNDALFDTNVVGTFNIIDSIVQSNSSAKLVFASTDATYGTGFSDRKYLHPITETTPPQPTNFYGVTKVMGEDLVNQCGRLNDIDYTILRFAWVLAANELLELFTMGMWRDFMTHEQTEKLHISNAIPVVLEGDGSPFSDHIVDPRDAAVACLLAIRRMPSGDTFNICGPEPFRYLDYSPGIAERLGLELVELPLVNFHSYAFDGSKARERLNFVAQHNLDAVLSEAFALAKGADD